MMKILGVVLAGILALAVASPAAQKGGKPMFGEPMGRLWLADNLEAADDPPEGSYFVEFTGAQPFVHDTGGGMSEIALFTPDIDRIPQAGSAMMLDSNGYLASTPSGATNDFWLDIGTNPASFQWPQEPGITYHEGRVIGVSSTGAPSGLSLLCVPSLVAEITGVDLNTTSKTNLFTPASGQVWIVDYCIIRNASTSLTTVQFPLGSNANADDWLATDLYSELTTATKFTTVYPMDGAEVTTDSTPFGIKPTVAQGAAATVTIEVYAHRIS